MKEKLREILTSEEINRLDENEISAIYNMYLDYGQEVVDFLQKYARKEKRKFMALRWVSDELSMKRP